MKISMIATLFSGAVLLLATPFASSELYAQSNFRLSTGVEYSSGRYGGSDDIEELYVPVIVDFNTRRIGMSLTVPYLQVRAPSGTVTDGQALPGEGDITTESGLGDITANLTLYDIFYSADLDLALDITGSIKFGTADFDKGLGTGEADYSLYLDGYKWFDGFTLIGSVGYRWRGEPAGVTLDYVLVVSVGGSWPAGHDSALGMFFDYRQSSLPGYDDVQKMTAFGSLRLGEHWYLQLYGFAGLTDSSPDWGGGFTITTSLRRVPTRVNP